MKNLCLDPTREYHLKFRIPNSEPWISVIDQMPRNDTPDDAYFVSRRLSFWWERKPEQIDGITIHHTLTHNMMAVANYVTRSVRHGGKGRPTTEYTFWVTIDGEVKLCNDLLWGCWHDHCGHRNTHISVGLAGRWDYEKPPQVQLLAAAGLIKHLQEMYKIPLVNVKGHNEWAQIMAGIHTACPGWNKSGWKGDLFKLLDGSQQEYSLRSTIRQPHPQRIERLFDVVLE